MTPIQSMLLMTCRNPIDWWQQFDDGILHILSIAVQPTIRVPCNANTPIFSAAARCH